MAINMAYCRFENTLQALSECAGVLDEDDRTKFSESEMLAARHLIDLCEQIADDYGIIWRRNNDNK